MHFTIIVNNNNFYFKFLINNKIKYKLIIMYKLIISKLIIRKYIQYCEYLYKK